MGSSGTNSFTDYPGSQSSDGTGGSEQNNQCERAIGNIPLEDVANCEYYQTNRSVPPVGTNIRIRETLYHGRLVVEDFESTIIGLLPTQYNYLRQCMVREYRYSGNIISSRNRPLPTVNIDLAPVG